ncbi:MAG: HNH endonuclease family protein [Dehalococcoidia bacterium]
MARLESDVSHRDCDPDTDSGSIEHILPENPTAGWEGSISASAWEAAAYRLGNLTLLESSANRQVGNLGYEEKVAAYRKSGYALTRAIPEMAPEEWTLPLLEKRQRQLADRAVRVWRADFA